MMKITIMIIITSVKWVQQQSEGYDHKSKEIKHKWNEYKGYEDKWKVKKEWVKKWKSEYTTQGHECNRGGNVCKMKEMNT